MESAGETPVEKFSRGAGHEDASPALGQPVHELVKLVQAIVAEQQLQTSFLSRLAGQRAAPVRAWNEATESAADRLGRSEAAAASQPRQSARHSAAEHARVSLLMMEGFVGEAQRTSSGSVPGIPQESDFGDTSPGWNELIGCPELVTELEAHRLSADEDVASPLPRQSARLSAAEHARHSLLTMEGFMGPPQRTTSGSIPSMPETEFGVMPLTRMSEVMHSIAPHHFAERQSAEEWNSWQLPEGIPLGVRFMLALMGLVDIRNLQTKPSRRVYFAFSKFVIPLAYAWCTVGLMAEFFVGVQYFGEFDPLPLFTAIAVALCVVPCWISMSNEFSKGAILKLLRHVMKRQYSWRRLQTYVQLWIFFGTALVLVYIASLLLPIFLGRSMFQRLLELGYEDARAWSRPVMVLALGRTAAAGLVWMLMFGMVIMAFFIADLHKFSMMWYVRTVAVLLKDTSTNPVAAMTHGEKLLTSCLHHASCSYVRWWIWSGQVLIIMVAVLISGVATGGIRPEFTARAVLLLVGFLMALFGILLPLAHVAETFEYDAAEVLNVPDVLHGSLRWFGPTLLPHLQRLQWGFRVGGNLINVRAGAKVASALTIAALAAVSQNAMMRLSG